MNSFAQNTAEFQVAAQNRISQQQSKISSQESNAQHNFQSTSDSKQNLSSGNQNFVFANSGLSDAQTGKNKFTYDQTIKLMESRKQQMAEDQKSLSKQLFQDANTQLYKFYKESLKQKEEQYIQGKEDAFAEIIKLLTSFKSARDIKHVPITQFMMALQQKLKELRDPRKGKERQSIPSSENSYENHLGQENNNSANLVSQNTNFRSLVAATNLRLSTQTRSFQNPQVQCLERDFKSIAIDALANQAERETKSIVATTSAKTQKFIEDLSMIKIRESRKRLRPKMDAFSQSSNLSAFGAFAQRNSNDSDDDEIKEANLPLTISKEPEFKKFRALNTNQTPTVSQNNGSATRINNPFQFKFKQPPESTQKE